MAAVATVFIGARGMTAGILAGFLCCIFSFPLGGPFAREHMVTAFRAVTSRLCGATPSLLRHTSALPPTTAIFPRPPPPSQGQAPPTTLFLHRLPFLPLVSASPTSALRFPLLRFVSLRGRRDLLPSAKNVGVLPHSGQVRFVCSIIASLFRFILPARRGRNRADCSRGRYFQLKCRIWWQLK
jgi:hypothetical protein